MLLPIIPLEIALSKSTEKSVSEYNASASKHNEKVATFEALAVELTAPPEDISASVLFSRSGLVSDRFTLRQSALKLRHSLTPILAARRVDRQQRADELHTHSEPVRQALLAKLHKIGFVGDGVQYDQRVRGSIMPGTVANHPAVSDARNAANDASILAQSFHDSSVNVEEIASLTKLIAATISTIAAA